MTLTRRELHELADELEATFESDAARAYRARYNVAPTDLHPVLRVAAGARRLDMLRWGFESEGKKAIINARAESAPVRPMFQDAFDERRCVVPADGFFEWKVVGKDREPLWFHRPDGKLLLLAGLWETARGRPGEPPRFTVLTTSPNALVREIHDRMPAILSPDEARAWLQEASLELLHPAPEGLLEARPVSRRVNAVKNDDPRCLEPVDPSAAPRQLDLL